MASTVLVNHHTSVLFTWKFITSPPAWKQIRCVFISPSCSSGEDSRPQHTASEPERRN
jgi:hypothetical protein